MNFLDRFSIYINLYHLDFKKIFDSNFGKFPESLKDCYFKIFYLATIYFLHYFNSNIYLYYLDLKNMRFQILIYFLKDSQTNIFGNFT